MTNQQLNDRKFRDIMAIISLLTGIFAGLWADWTTMGLFFIAGAIWKLK